MVNFFTEDTSIDLSILTFVPSWISTVSCIEGYTIESLNYIFCSDAYLLQINIEYLQHNYFTDIITFDNSDFSKVLDGDIFISIDRVEENAQIMQISFLHELLRVIIHGVLHLMGHDDKDDISKTDMHKMEDIFLDLYFREFHKSV